MLVQSYLLLISMNPIGNVPKVDGAKTNTYKRFLITTLYYLEAFPMV